MQYWVSKRYSSLWKSGTSNIFEDVEAKNHMPPAAGIDEATPQGWRRQVARGEEATSGATAARSQPARQPRSSPESLAAAP